MAETYPDREVLSVVIRLARAKEREHEQNVESEAESIRLHGHRPKDAPEPAKLALIKYLDELDGAQRTRILARFWYGRGDFSMVGQALHHTQGMPLKDIPGYLSGKMNLANCLEIVHPFSTSLDPEEEESEIAIEIEQSFTESYDD